jgi:hypothetical protein
MKESFHRAAQQGRMMTRQGRDDQKLLARLGGPGVKLLFKMEKLGKRPLPGHPLDDRNNFAVNGRRCEIECGLVVTPGQPLENFAEATRFRPAAIWESGLMGYSSHVRATSKTARAGAQAIWANSCIS